MVDLVRRHPHERRDPPALQFEGGVTTYGTLLRNAEAFGRSDAAIVLPSERRRRTIRKPTAARLPPARARIDARG